MQNRTLLDKRPMITSKQEKKICTSEQEKNVNRQNKGQKGKLLKRAKNTQDSRYTSEQEGSTRIRKEGYILHCWA